jgi:hypothetical protein
LEEHPFTHYFIFDKLVKMGNTTIKDVDTELCNDTQYSDLKKDVYQKLFNHFKTSDIIHLSGYRWHSYYRVMLVNILKELDNDMSNKIELTYGVYDWNTHKF